MTYQFNIEPRTCKHCKAPFQPKSGNQKFCSVECKLTFHSSEFKDRNPEYWNEYRQRSHAERVKRPGPLNPPFNPKPCRYCLKPLGRTPNRWYHPNCHSRASHIVGIEEVSVQL